MVKHIDEIAQIIAQIERAAYQKGWNAALEHVVNVARKPIPPDQQQSLPLQAANGKHIAADAPHTMIEMVKETIADHTGLRGADIVSAVHKRMPDKDRKSIDRTVRTAIMRLKKRGKIESMGGKWYPAASDSLMSQLEDIKL